MYNELLKCSVTCSCVIFMYLPKTMRFRYIKVYIDKFAMIIRLLS